VTDVGVVLVNYQSGWLAASAVASLRAQRFAGRDGGDGTLSIAVVDNASPSDQRPALDPLRDLGVTVIHHRENVGYGRGMNLGIQAIEAEYVLLANPDILVLDGALDALLRLMRGDASIGLAGPRGYLDPGRFVMLPPNDLPSLSLHALESLSRAHSSVARRTAKARSRRFLAAWSASGPFDTAMISGFAMFMKTSLARRLGPFDPHFPFYFEDADLCRRVRRAGFRVVLEPRAEMVHFFDQSARSARAEVMAKHAISRAYYYRKHYGAFGARVFAAFDRYAQRRGRGESSWRFHEPRDLGGVATPPSIALESKAPWLLEISTDPYFMFCGGHLGEGEVATIGASGFAMLDATRWYVRILDRESLALRAYVTFEKTVHALGPTSYAQYLATRDAAR
jgi:GT2 family glycosyltransferase